MFYSNDNRGDLRQHYFNVWQKLNQSLPLTPLENEIALVIRQHPEYHSILDDRETYLDADFSAYSGSANPFMHMGMHIALNEQLSTNRPKSIRNLFIRAQKSLGQAHEAEHLLMEALYEAIWYVQENEKPMTDEKYLKILKKILSQYRMIDMHVC